MLQLLSHHDSRRLRVFFEEIDYTEPNLRKHLGAPELPSRSLRNMARLLDRTSEPSTVNTLLRWFWLGIAQTRAQSEDLIPSEILALLLQSGLLAEEEGGNLVPAAMLLPIEGYLVASDHPIGIENKQVEMVLWPNPTSKFLSRFAVRRHARTTLDLGTGSGILSLGAAQYSDHVVATDLNERAVDCARFNARLNGAENIEVVSGDCFAPVAGRRFDLILSNPPFFITPQTEYLFCENTMELDGLCRRLVKEAPAYLNEGGYMQMLCEWAQLKEQPWQERVAEWLEGTGCDAWVMKGLSQDPEEYAQHRIKEMSNDSSRDNDLYTGYMSYYRHRGVEAIHDGLIVMRRREGQNFVRIEEVPTRPGGELGEMVLATFSAHDLLRANDTDDKLLAIRPRLADNVRFEQVCKPVKSQWQAETLTLRLISGFPFHMAVQPLVAEFLVTCDGTRTAEEAIAAFAASAGAPLATVQAECLSMIRKLVERGFIIAA
ncbi:MAG TPA: class I SAM-dependent methyltransferase [Terracidiphilus sp.]|jgi:methylase of polypeptide subunit release factors